MTAFARCERQGEWGSLTMELRSVNHRYLELSLRLPEELRALEPKMREKAGTALRRGKVDCNVRFSPPEGSTGLPELNRELVEHLAHLNREVDGIVYNSAPTNAFDVLKWPGVLQTPELDTETIQKEALALLDSALAEMNATREREGEKLKQFVLQRCDGIADVAQAAQKRVPEVREHLYSRLRGRLEEVKGELDESRLEQEMVILANKLDVDEELDRLQAHLSEVKRVLDQDEPVGRRLDFLMQELNREANTLGSKSSDTETTRASVDLKVYIEQMREQIQNIE